MKKRLLSFLIVVLIVFGAFCAPNTIYASETTRYTSVMEDLKKSPNFSVFNFPQIRHNFSLEVITVAEGADGDLFVYVYQPTGSFCSFYATSINISKTLENPSFRNYALEFINCNETLYKYRVKDFEISSGEMRYCVISSIFRSFIKFYDTAATHENSIAEVAYDVSKEFVFRTVDNESVVSCFNIETITVTDKFVGFVRYPPGYSFALNARTCDSHFVAFSTNKPIERLFEADVSFVKQEYAYSFSTVTSSESFGDQVSETVNLTYKDKVNYTPSGIFAPTFTWDRIESVEDFIDNVDETRVYSGGIIGVSYGTPLTSDAKQALVGKTWVLRFTETEYTYEHYSSGFSYNIYENSSFVGEVSILRLKFETDGVTYDLGVIDNKQTGSGSPVNTVTRQISLNPDFNFSFDFDWLKYLLAAIMLFAILALFAPLLPYIVKGIIWLITLPFKVISSILKALKKQRKNKPKRGK